MVIKDDKSNTSRWLFVSCLVLLLLAARANSMNCKLTIYQGKSATLSLADSYCSDQVLFKFFDKPTLGTDKMMMLIHKWHAKFIVLSIFG